jgi:hypothetical protein
MWDLDEYHAMIEYCDKYNMDLYTFCLNVIAIPDDILDKKDRLKSLHSSIEDLLLEHVLDHPRLPYNPTFVEDFLKIRCGIRRIDYKKYNDIMMDWMHWMTHNYMEWGLLIWDAPPYIDFNS